MPDNIDVKKNPKEILGQLIGQGGNVFEQIKKEEGEKVLREFLKTKGQEALQQPGGAEQLAQSISQQPKQQGQPQQQLQQTEGQQFQFPEQQGIPEAPAQNILQRLFSALPGGNARDLEVRNQQLQNVALEQSVQGTQPIQPIQAATLNQEEQKQQARVELETFKQDRLDERERIKASLRDSGADESQISAEIFQNDLVNLVSDFDSIFLKGGPLGSGGAIGAVGGLLGAGTEGRAKFEASNSAFLFSAASFIANQEGRALSDKDIVRVEKIAGLNLGMKKGEFLGKIQAVINLANTRAKAAGSSQRLPSARELVKMSKQKKKSVESNSVSSTPISTSSGKKYIIKQRGQ